MPDFSITTWGCPAAEPARDVFDCGAGAGVAAATADAFGTASSFVSDAARSCSRRGRGVFFGLTDSPSVRADFDFAVFFVFPDVSFARDFFFPAFGLGVGVWLRLVFDEVFDFLFAVFAFGLGVGDFFGFEDDAS